MFFCNWFSINKLNERVQKLENSATIATPPDRLCPFCNKGNLDISNMYKEDCNKNFAPFDPANPMRIDKIIRETKCTNCKKELRHSKLANESDSEYKFISAK